MPPSVASVIGLIAGITAVVLLYVLVLPRKMDGNLNNKFLQFLHDFFHFKKLYLEVILKFCFAFLSILCVTIGFFLMFAQETYWGYTQSYFVTGFCMLLFGPVILRISYEMIMMAVLLVQNVMDINQKLAGPKKEANVTVNKVPVNKVPVNNVPVNNVPVNNIPVNNVPVNNVPVNNVPVNNGFVAGSDMYVAPQEQPQNPQW